MISTTSKTVSILGCGWFGFELAKRLVEKNYIVKGSTTTETNLQLLAENRITPFLVDFQKDEEFYDPAFFQTNVLFICIPPNKRGGQQSDYLDKIKRIVEAAKQNNVAQVVFTSSTAVYGDTNADVNELTVPQPETASSKAILESEQLLRSQTTFTCTILRFAGLIGPNRDPGRFFAGKTAVANGRAPINLIHLDDCVGLSLCILEDAAFGHIFNACTPHHPSKQQFYVAAASKAGLLPPAFIDELLNWKVVTTIQSSMLNYQYRVSNWMDWIKI